MEWNLSQSHASFLLTVLSQQRHLTLFISHIHNVSVLLDWGTSGTCFQDRILKGGSASCTAGLQGHSCTLLQLDSLLSPHPPTPSSGPL